MLTYKTTCPFCGTALTEGKQFKYECNNPNKKHFTSFTGMKKS